MDGYKRRMLVGRVDDQGDHVLLYYSTRPQPNEYHVIAKAGCGIKPGAVIEYEPIGANFGWHIEDAATALRFYVETDRGVYGGEYMYNPAFVADGYAVVVETDITQTINDLMEQLANGETTNTL